MISFEGPTCICYVLAKMEQVFCVCVHVKKKR